MAKRKTKKCKIKKFLPLLIIIWGVVALAMMFLPAVVVKDTDKTYTGLQLAFGYSSPIIGGGVSLKVFEFSIMNALTYAFVLSGIIFAIIGQLGKGNKLSSFICALLFVSGGIFFFLQGSFCLPVVAQTKNLLTLGLGSIIGGVTSILAGISSLGYVILK